jgi:hypothetical protein
MLHALTRVVDERGRGRFVQVRAPVGGRRPRAQHGAFRGKGGEVPDVRAFIRHFLPVLLN